MAETAVVILNYNGRTYLEQFLPHVITHSREAEIIIADNDSTDDSISFLKTHYPDIALISLKKNYGYAGGYNKVLEQLNHKYVVLLNSDIEVTENWLEPMSAFLDKNANYAGCQPKIKDFNHQSRFEYAGASGGFIDTLGYPYCRGRIFDELEIDAGQYNEPADIFWASGACMMVRKKVFDEAGGFDSDFFAHMEEIDLCWRTRSMGYKFRAIPDSMVFHIGGGTLNKTSPFKTYLNFRNGLYLLLKNLPFQSLFIKLPIRIVLDWMAALKFLLETKPKHSFAIIKAHFIVVSRIFVMFGKRKYTSKLPNSKSIVWQYFIKKRQKYSEL